MSNTTPIGLFDSGIGGTSIWAAINDLLPHENTIYLADSKNAPYGQRSKEEIIALSCKNTEYLLNQNAKLIVVACNTATTNAITELRTLYDVPFIGIEPAIKPAATHTKTQIIGVLATKGTINSQLFNAAVAKYKNVKIIEQIGFGLVQLIENGDLHSPEMTELLQTYLAPMIKANIDYLVLGCTHYPYLIPQIRKIIPEHVKIIDSGEAVARQTSSILTVNNALNSDPTKGAALFYTNASKKVLSEILNDYEATISEKEF
ncbi:glutamate racemase [Flavobacterium kingsejongi]|uniref:Glutamate racemase n=1 Tax=Flavobacterium kingsejongi TaxID=1678728 RepID=A0A2S1LJY6_9FLAO|nr:glutamate racemase [Flavobacterium kingsejongi]AWG24001.1 glutamate racemase [Flavobacterium kingsejongi]